MTEVKDTYRSNGTRFAACCWTCLKRKTNGYHYHPSEISLSTYLKNEDEFWTFFIGLGKTSGWVASGKMHIPYIDLEHLDREDEPIRVEDLSLVGEYSDSTYNDISDQASLADSLHVQHSTKSSHHS